MEGTFVPNDTFCTAEKNVSLITGPNSSGKVRLIRPLCGLYLAPI